MDTRFLSASGTLALALVTKHGAYLAADSRKTNPSVDSAQKVFQCGPNTLIAIVGTLVGNSEKLSLRKATMFKGVIDLTELLHHICATYSNEDVIPHIVGHLYRSIKRWWDFVGPDADQLLATYDGLCFATIPIVQRNGGDVVVSETHFMFSETAELLQPTHKIRFHQRVKSTEVAYVWGQHPELEGIDFEPDTPEAALESIAALFARATIAYPQTVGGPTDIAVLDANGARWISRKGSLDQSAIDH
jgi:hypothetical protein